ncbi:MAG: fluoride efflux transporter CrcB [Endomicrobia bacterium]|nr:fluoride efflux transporter CrcB [Endomicrobiia bacterium]
MFQNAFAVFFGGAFGALFRFLISEFFPVSRWGIPFTIIAVNFLGCFIMGFIDSLYENGSQSIHVKHFVIIGFLGGFTTFSAFSLEFSTLVKNGNFVSSIVYLSVSMSLAIFGFFAGYMLAKVFKQN